MEPKRSFLKRGKSVLATAEAELTKSMSPSLPVYRFWLRPGTETEAIILDASFEEAVGFYEHNTQNAGGSWGNYVACTRKNCSFCQTYGESRYMIFMTILDLRSYVKKTGEMVSFVKMLLPIGLNIFPQFQVILSTAMKEAGTLRGTCVKVKRESSYRAIWRFKEVLDENTLIKNYGKDACPFDYDEVFKKWAN